MIQVAKVTQVFICISPGKIAGSDLFTARPAAPCPTPGSKHKGQTHSQSNLLYFHLPGREGGEIKKKKKIPLSLLTIQISM